MADTLYDKEYVYEPLLAYDQIFKEEHHKNTTAFFDDLVKKSKINKEENKLTNKELVALDKKRNAVQKKINNQSALKGFLIFLLIAFVVVIGVSIYMWVDSGYHYIQPILIGVSVILFVLFLLLIIKKIKPKLVILKGEKTVLDKKYKETLELAWAQMAPLNNLFTYGQNTAIFRKTLPLIDLDKMFDSKRLDYMVAKFGLNSTPDLDRSALYVQSGDINGNPFYIARDLVHQLGTKTYTGSIVIHWTTVSTDSKGRPRTVHHSQTLTAQVTKPCPYYHESPYIVYANEAAPDLIFSREDSNAEHMEEKEIDKFVKKQSKKLRKKQEKGLKTGSNYTVMGNTEFEVLFGGSNRNNEVQFRLLFTALAQKQLLQLMKDKKIGFGDNFDFRKHKMINVVFPEHLQSFDLNVSPSYFKDYNIDVIEKKFIDYNNGYFKAIYFGFAPILSIPLYQHQKPHEYIYKDKYNSYVSFYEHEQVVNMMNETQFKHPLSKTRNILKTSTVKSGNHCDTVKVTAYGYDAIQRTDYISKMGGDGRMHMVPVNWVEYISVSQDTNVDINVLVEDKKPESYNEKIRAIFEKFQDRQVTTDDMVKVGPFIAYIASKTKDVI
ncbi:MAG: hypothetical protein PHF62_02675 [Acholeplasmataceae bacterium]|nr:hypothetical protein [Acholeplasmataceae bacterium]